MRRAFLVGNLVKDPELRKTQNEVSVCTFTVACNGRRKDETTFLNIVTWRGLADNCYRYLTKGRRVAVVGKINNRSYEAKDGTKRTVTEIVADDVEFLSSGRKEDFEEVQDEENPYEQDYPY